MRNISLAFLFLCTCSMLCAQTYSASLDQSDAVEALPSSIDLLKRSIGASKNNSSIKSTSTQTVSAPVSSKTASTKSDTKATNRSQNYLEMPLSSGSVVKTQVPKQIAPKSKPQIINPTVTTTNKQTPSKTPLEAEIEQNNALAEGEKSGTAKVAVPTPSVEKSIAAEEVSSVAESDTIAQEELDYAARMLQQEKQNNTGERFIPQAASKSAQEGPIETEKAKRPFDPNDFRPGVDWMKNNSTHFIIYTQKREGGISSSNMGMIFETAYATLRRNIPWMMSEKVRVFVYQDHNSYLKYEPNAKPWTRALAYPTRGEIVVYDEPGKQQELKEVFTHELVHIFTQQFFDKHKTGRLITPTWLDEGLAVYMEDQAYNGIKGGPWANDLKTLNIQRSQRDQVANFGSTSMFGSSRSKNTFRRTKQGPPLYLMPFDQFMSDGSLSYMESQNKTQDWYFQAYAMVRFLLNPAGGSSPSNRMQFEQFTRLISQGEQVRDPNTGFPMRGRNGKPIYQPYSVEKAMGRAYRYSNAANFEDNFWRWANNQ